MARHRMLSFIIRELPCILEEDNGVVSRCFLHGSVSLLLDWLQSKYRQPALPWFLTYRWGWDGCIPFPKSVSLKLNAKISLEFELCPLIHFCNDIRYTTRILTSVGLINYEISLLLFESGSMCWGSKRLRTITIIDNTNNNNDRINWFQHQLIP